MNLIQQVERIAQQSKSWSDFRDLVYFPNGILQSYFKSLNDYLEFTYSPEYQQISKIAYQVIEKFDFK